MTIVDKKFALNFGRSQSRFECAHQKNEGSRYEQN